jgi:hypothetical protein
VEDFSFAVGDGLGEVFAERGEVRGSFDWRYAVAGVAELFEDVHDGDCVVALVFFELADATDGDLIGTARVKADTREGFLCVLRDGASGILEGL